VKLLLRYLGVVGFHSEAGQPIVVDVDTPGVHRSDQNIQAQVKFEAVNEERVVDVLADNAIFVDRNFRNIVNLSQYES
jgi:GTPase Era involved in 16S rRNA processing